MQISTAEKVWGAIGYLGILFLIPLKVERESMFVQFHSRQGGVLFALWAVMSLVLVILLFVLDGINVAATTILAILFILMIVYVVMVAIAILKVALGERYRMPVVADVALWMRL